MYSVIIPSLGRIKFLNELLGSIYKQTFLPEEIIIILENTKECRDIEQLINKKFNIRVIFTDNLKTPQKRNLGTKIASSEYIIFSDDDDIWENNKAELTMNSLKSVQVVCHAHSKFSFDVKKFKYNLGKIKKQVSLITLIYGDNIFGGGSGIAAKKEIFLTIPFNEDLYSEDYDWWVKVLLADIKVEYIPEALVRYRIHDKNMTSNYKKIYFYNLKLFNKILNKSFILLLTFINGYLRIIIKLIIKLLLKNIISLKIFFLKGKK